MLPSAETTTNIVKGSLWTKSRMKNIMKELTDEINYILKNIRTIILTSDYDSDNSESSYWHFDSKNNSVFDTNFDLNKKRLIIHLNLEDEFENQEEIVLVFEKKRSSLEDLGYKTSYKHNDDGQYIGFMIEIKL